jgi:hypothetical protein
MLFTAVAVCPVSHNCQRRRWWQVKLQNLFVDSTQYAVLLTVHSMQFSWQCTVCSFVDSTQYAVLLTVHSMQFCWQYTVCSFVDSTQYAVFFFYFLGSTTQVGQGAPHFWDFEITHISTAITQHDSSGWVIGPLQRPLPDNTHNCRNRQTFMSPAGSESAIPTIEQLQTHQYVQLRLFKYQWSLYVPQV